MSFQLFFQWDYFASNIYLFMPYQNPHLGRKVSFDSTDYCLHPGNSIEKAEIAFVDCNYSGFFFPSKMDPSKIGRQINATLRRTFGSGKEI